MGEARCDADSLSARHATLRRRVRQLYNGYRALRFKLEDEWPSGAGGCMAGWQVYRLEGRDHQLSYHQTG